MTYNYKELQDWELWNLIRMRSDTIAFAELHARYSSKLFALAYRKIGDTATAEDIVQDLYVILWTRRDQILIKKSIKVYLFTALKNKIISFWRKNLHAQSVDLGDVQTKDISSLSSNAVDDWIGQQEVENIYRKELENLPERSREVFELSRNGLTNKDVAELLGITEKTIEFHISKCLKTLRSKLAYFVTILLLLVS